MDRTTPAITTSLCFDRGTQHLLERLHRAWDSHAPASTYAALAATVLRQREHIDTRILTLAAVVQVACPTAITDGGDDDTWSELLTAARHVSNPPPLPKVRDKHSDSHLKRRKRAHNEINRLRNLAFITALWSPALVAYYGWNMATQTQMNMLRACASRYPRFRDDFRPRLNCVLLDRHRQGLQDVRTQTLTEAPLQPHRDFNPTALAAAVPDLDLQAQWTTNQDGVLFVDAQGSLTLRDLRPTHFRMHLLQHDRYGLLISRIDPEIGPPPNPITTILRDLPSYTATGFEQHKSPSLSSGSNISSGGDCFGSSINGDSTSRDSSVSTSSSPCISLGMANALPPTARLEVPSSTLSSDEAHAYEQFCLGTGFDFDANNSSNFPSLPVFSWRQDGLSSPTAQIPSAVTGSPGVFPNTTLCDQMSRIDQPASVQGQTLASPIEPVANTSTMEEALHSKYHEMIADYINECRYESTNPDVSDQHLERASWLSGDTLWASVWTHPESQLRKGRAESSEEADILVLRSQELMAALQEGKVFHKPIIVKEVFSDSGMYTLDALSLLLRHTLTPNHVDSTGLVPSKPKSASIDEIADGLRNSSVHGNATRTLNLHGITRSHRPLLTMLPRFRLLDSLIAISRGNVPAELSPVNLDWLQSNTLTLKNAFFGAQLNAIGGVWMRNLSGVRFWTMVPQSNMEAQHWAACASAGNQWLPQGKQRFFVLEQDDVLLIPPGICVAHALHSPTNVLTEGGILWDALNVDKILNSISWALKHQRDQHNSTIRQLQQLVAELVDLVKHQLHEFQGDRSEDDFMLAFRQAVARFNDLDCT